MYDFSPIYPQMQAQGQVVPGVSNLRNAPQAIEMGMNTLAQREAEDILKRRGKALAEKAQAVGLDPNMVETIANVDLGKGIDYLIKGTEAFNNQEAERYVGEELGKDQFDPTKYTNEQGIPMPTSQAQDMWHKERRGKITSGMEKAQSPYVRKAYEARLTDLDKQTSNTAAQRSQARIEQGDMKMARDNLSAALKAADLTDVTKVTGSALGIDKNLQDIDKMASELESSAGLKPGEGLGVYAFGPAMTALEQSGLLNQVVNGILQWKDAGLQKEYANRLAKGESTQQALEAMTKSAQGQAAIKLNDALYSTLVLGIFQRIHDLTGAAMSNEERNGYLKQAGEGGPAGIMGVIDEYERTRVRKNRELQHKKQQAIANLGVYYGDTSNEYYTRMVDYINGMPDLPPFPARLKKALQDRVVMTPGQTATLPAQSSAPAAPAPTPSGGGSEIDEAASLLNSGGI